MKTTLATTVALALALAAQAEFKVDRAAMSEKYWSIWNDEVQAKIDADIERNRKADATFEVAAPDGAEVKVEQIGHAFRFGAHIFNYDQLGKKEWNDAYKASYGEGGIFNQATVAFYWREYEPVPGRFRAFGDYEDTARFWNSLTRAEAMEHPFWRRPAPAPAVNYLRSRGVAIHGHILIWGKAKPNWIYDWYCPENEKRFIDEIGISRHSAHLGWEPCGQNWHRGYMGKWAKAWCNAYDGMIAKGLDEKALSERIPRFVANMRRIFRKRVFDVAGAYGDVVDSFDIVNESAQDWVRYRKAQTGLSVWFSSYGLMPGNYPLNALLDAKEAFPAKANLAINDYNISPDFLAQVKDLDDEGAKIDIVGCQMHLFNTNDCMRLALGETGISWISTPADIRGRLDMMAKTGRPLHVSEVTITSPGADDRSRMIQAVLTRNIYRAWFSHPKTMGITWWNTVDGGGVKCEPLVSGLFTTDLRHKPAYDALDDLINREWKTKTTAKASGGKVAFRGFKGRYRLSWKDAEGKDRSKFVEVE